MGVEREEGGEGEAADDDIVAGGRTTVWHSGGVWQGGWATVLTLMHTVTVYGEGMQILYS